jgi:DNA-binding transcriptional LysR family regulator
VGSNVAIRESARVGLGITLISGDAAEPELATGQLAVLPVPGTPLHRDWYLVSLPGTLAQPAQWLVSEALTAGFRRPVS